MSIARDRDRSTMADHDTTIDNLLRSYDSVTVLAGQLDAGQLDTQSLCPDWTVKGVLAHILGLETVLTEWFPDSAEDPPPFDKMGPAFEEILGLEPDTLAERARSIIGARTGEVRALTADQLDTPCMTPVGPGTYGRFMAIRVFDLWVHEQDIRVPLELPGSTGGPTAEQAIDEIEGSMGYIIGKKVGLEDGRSIRFELTGPVERTIDVAVDGRAGVVDDLDAPDAVVTTDSLTFALLACGRIDPGDVISRGDITWSGDPDIGERAARNLRFTM